MKHEANPPQGHVSIHHYLVYIVARGTGRRRKPYINSAGIANGHETDAGEGN